MHLVGLDLNDAQEVLYTPTGLQITRPKMIEIDRFGADSSYLLLYKDELHRMMSKHATDIVRMLSLKSSELPRHLHEDNSELAWIVGFRLQNPKYTDWGFRTCNEQYNSYQKQNSRSIYCSLAFDSIYTITTPESRSWAYYGKVSKF